jgi:short-subunit dehydrogenase
MDKPIILITGCGYKPVGHIYEYKGKPTHNEIIIDGKKHKINIGTATAYYISKKGFEVIMVSRTAENLEKIKQGLIKLNCNGKLLSYIAADITSDEGIAKLIKDLPRNREIYWVQSIGMGGGAYKVPNDNIYLPFEKISPDLINAEMQIVTATHKLMLKMVPIFRRQIQKNQKAKICIITSMSGERGYHFGSTHVAAKHALVGYIKGIEKELMDEGIEIYDIRPGGIDTGMYDNPYTQKAVEEISRRTKMWGGKKPIYAEPMKVAQAIFKSLFDKKPRKLYKILAPFQK